MLPAGSVYSEPAGRAHFAQTGDEPVVVQITGNGPTDTAYEGPALDPARRVPDRAPARSKRS